MYDVRCVVCVWHCVVVLVVVVVGGGGVAAVVAVVVVVCGVVVCWHLLFGFGEVLLLMWCSGCVMQYVVLCARLRVMCVLCVML